MGVKQYTVLKYAYQETCVSHKSGDTAAFSHAENLLRPCDPKQLRVVTATLEALLQS